jgi:hypothetical protein
MLLAMLYFPLRFSNELGPHFVLLAAAGVMLSALRFLSAPAMALMSEQHLNGDSMVQPIELRLASDGGAQT